MKKVLIAGLLLAAIVGGVIAGNVESVETKQGFTTLWSVRDELNDLAAGGTLTNGLTINAGGLTVTAGGATVTAGGLTVTAGDTTVNSGVTIITGAYTGVLDVVSTTLTFVVNGSITNVLDADITN